MRTSVQYKTKQHHKLQITLESAECGLNASAEKGKSGVRIVQLK